MNHKRSTSQSGSQVGGPRHSYSPNLRKAEVSPAHKRQQWLAYAVIFGIVAIAFGFGVGSVVHSEQQRALALEAIAAESAIQESASAGNAEGAEGTVADGQQAPTAETLSLVDAKLLSGRDADFAVDPERATWSYDDNGRKTVYLTIDDGPSENTQAVLDILDAYGCKATFFVVGHNDDFFPMIAEAYRRGHTIGLHSMTHDYAEVYSSVDAYFADLEGIAQVVKDQIGYVPCFIRFPGGSSNLISADYTEGIMTELTGLVQERGFQYYDWNVSTGDGSDHTADELVSYACEETDAENIVMLCHDSATKQTTVEALPRIIEHYQSLGYSFEALDRSSWVCHHGVNN